ncbi:5-oxoprolinase/urea amidolyase family protein [Pseudolysinimonas kribbensis]|uniref:5-oxoprolinase subunit C family protein n=1 Tax=Pseudolysinimonas kribbensis TaxID=433641 RepID=UPI0031D691B9
MTGRRELNVLAPGILSLIEDAGRLGWLSAGVGVSGAADPGSYELANRLVANPPGAAAIEVTMGGLRAEVGCRTVVAVTGAPAQLTVDGRAFGHDSVVPVEPGQVIELGMPPVGVRSYLAIRGGIDVEPVLGSRSTDTMSGLGPPALAAGDVLPIGAEPAEWPIVDVAPVPPLEAGTVVVRAMAGPRAEWFAAPHVIFETEWIASPASDRIGVRLDPADPAARPARAIDGELPVEGMPLGAIQVPPSGQPVAFLADHPVTGGYPVIATVDRADIGRLAQLRPGQRVRFAQHRR